MSKRGKRQAFYHRQKVERFARRFYRLMHEDLLKLRERADSSEVRVCNVCSLVCDAHLGPKECPRKGVACPWEPAWLAAERGRLP